VTDGADPGQDVPRRAASAVKSLGARGVVVGVLGIAGNLALARLLTPRDFGLVALGTTLLVAGRFLGEGGLGVALIGRVAAPTRRELEAVLGVQLAATTALAVLAGAVALSFGAAGAVPALMLVALPLETLRVPGVIVLERELDYRRVACADIVEAVVQYGWAIGAVAVGWGVWGLASAAVVRTLAGSVTMTWLAPCGLVRPRLSWREVRPLLGFGVRIQGANLVMIAREAALNAGIAAIGGVAALGVWALAVRVMQVPMIAFTTLGRVAYPAMARLRAGRVDADAVERGIGVVAVALGPIPVGVAAAAPALLPALLGARWSGVSSVLVPAAAGMSIAAPVVVAAGGALLAAGKPGEVLAATVVNALVWVAIALGLLTTLGLSALGVGWLAGSVAQVVVLRRAAARDLGARTLTPLATPAAVTLAAGAAGWTVASTIGGARGRPRRGGARRGTARRRAACPAPLRHARRSPQRAPGRAGGRVTARRIAAAS
jgi:O-antigen/teichoic acid export membrane protein